MGSDSASDIKLPLHGHDVRCLEGHSTTAGVFPPKWITSSNLETANKFGMWDILQNAFPVLHECPCPEMQRQTEEWTQVKRYQRHLSSSVWAAVTKYHELGGVYTTEIYFLTVLEAGSPRPGRQHDWVLVRASFGCRLCHCDLTWWKGPSPSPSGLGFQYMNWRVGDTNIQTIAAPVN